MFLRLLGGNGCGMARVSSHDQGSSNHEPDGFFVDASRVAWEGRVPARLAQPDRPSVGAGRVRKDSDVFFDGDGRGMGFVGVSRNAHCDVSFAPGRWDLAQDARLRVGAADRAELAQRRGSAVEHVHDRVGRGDLPLRPSEELVQFRRPGLRLRLSGGVAQAPRGVSGYCVRRGDAAVTAADGPVHDATLGQGTRDEAPSITGLEVDRPRRRAWRLAPAAGEHPDCGAEQNPAPNNATHGADDVKRRRDKPLGSGPAPPGSRLRTRCRATSSS